MDVDEENVGMVNTVEVVVGVVVGAVVDVVGGVDVVMEVVVVDVVCVVVRVVMEVVAGRSGGLNDRHGCDESNCCALLPCSKGSWLKSTQLWLYAVTC